MDTAEQTLSFSEKAIAHNEYERQIWDEITPYWKIIYFWAVEVGYSGYAGNSEYRINNVDTWWDALEINHDHIRLQYSDVGDNGNPKDMDWEIPLEWFDLSLKAFTKKFRDRLKQEEKAKKAEALDLQAARDALKEDEERRMLKTLKAKYEGKGK